MAVVWYLLGIGGSILIGNAIHYQQIMGLSIDTFPIGFVGALMVAGGLVGSIYEAVEAA